MWQKYIITYIKFPYLANEFCLGSFIMFTEIFKFVDFCISVRIMVVIVRAWFDALKRDSHAQSVRLDRYAYMYCTIFSSTVIENKLPGVGLVAYVLAVDCSVVVSVPTVVETV